jgi:hypothetical protein
MIYRILIDECDYLFDFHTHAVTPLTPKGALRGAASGLSDVMWDLGLPAPRITNPRARFYFTETGWRQIGLKLVRAARARGHVVQVIRRKNPERSQIIHRDDLQVAILPVKRE